MHREGRRDGPEHVLAARPGVSATDADVPDTSNALGVSFDATAEEWLGDFRARDASTGGDRVAVVSAGEHSRSAAVAGSGDGAGDDVLAELTGAVETVPAPSDVGAIGELVNEYLVRWRGDGDTTVYVDDLTTLLDSVSAETAFTFVHAVLARANSTAARVVVSVDADAHAPHVVGTFAALFDDVRE